MRRGEVEAGQGDDAETAVLRLQLERARAKLADLGQEQQTTTQQQD